MTRADALNVLALSMTAAAPMTTTARR